MAKQKCSMCSATQPFEFYNCVYCGELVCDECALQCDKCKKFYCGNGICGDEYLDESHYIHCSKCR